MRIETYNDSTYVLMTSEEAEDFDSSDYDEYGTYMGQDDSVASYYKEECCFVFHAEKEDNEIWRHTNVWIFKR